MTVAAPVVVGAARGAQQAAPGDRRHVQITLYVLTASHPCIAAELMLRRKGLHYRRGGLPPILSRGILRATHSPRKPVPAMRVGRRRVRGSRAISRALEELRPAPPLFPLDPRARERV